MREYLSVLLLLLKRALKAAVPILAAMVALEIFLFFLLTVGLRSQEAFWLEDLVEESRMKWVCAAAFVLLCAQMVRVSSDGSGSQSYSLRRLAISEKSVSICHVLALWVCFLLLWAVQLLTALLLLWWISKSSSAAGLSSQSVFLAFYRNPFLHNLFPLEDWLYWFRNLILTAGLSLSAAACGSPLAGNTGKRILAAFAAVTLVCFTIPLGSLFPNAIAIVGTLIVMKSVSMKLLRSDIHLVEDAK